MSQLNQNSIALEKLKTKAAALPAAITIDSTLTQSGQAADAKAVGDKLANHTQAASTINGGRFADMMFAGIGKQQALNSLLRNSSLAPATSNASPGDEGEICWTYE